MYVCMYVAGKVLSCAGHGAGLAASFGSYSHKQQHNAHPGQSEFSNTRPGLAVQTDPTRWQG